FQAALSAWNPTLVAAGASFRWGLADSGSVEGWTPGVRRLAESFYLDQPEPRLAWLSLVPVLSRGASVLLFRLGGDH
ncbi:MAG: hypothetical protein IH608_03385, partial [Proteobacteria bacterium]|nr:hypothetical protein [Pseudomonadota bacterium]